MYAAHQKKIMRGFLGAGDVIKGGNTPFFPSLKKNVGDQPRRVSQNFFPPGFFKGFVFPNRFLIYRGEKGFFGGEGYKNLGGFFYPPKIRPTPIGEKNFKKTRGFWAPFKKGFFSLWGF